MGRFGNRADYSLCQDVINCQLSTPFAQPKEQCPQPGSGTELLSQIGSNSFPRAPSGHSPSCHNPTELGRSEGGSEQALCATAGAQVGGLAGCSGCLISPLTSPDHLLPSLGSSPTGWWGGRQGWTMAPARRVGVVPSGGLHCLGKGCQRPGCRAIAHRTCETVIS